MNINRRVNRRRRAGIVVVFLIGCVLGGMNSRAVIQAKDITQLKDETRFNDETLAQKVKRIHLETRSFGDFK